MMIPVPAIWILLPPLIGILCFLLRNRRSIVLIIGASSTLILALIAAWAPFSRVITIFRWSFILDPQLFLLGRRFLIDTGDRVFIILILSITTFWFIGVQAARSSRLLVPIGMCLVSLLIAALAVEPFLYSALLIELAVLISIPLVAPPRQPYDSGVIRYLIFQTLAFPFILLAGLILEKVETNPSDIRLILQALTLLGLGFSFWLSVFPFYTWIPLLSEHTHPYTAGFIFIVFPTTVLLLGVKFLDQFSWLRNASEVYSFLLIVGALTVSTAGIWSAFQRNIARLLGYAVIMDTGFSLLALSLSSLIGFQIFAILFLPRVLQIAILSLSLSILQKENPESTLDAMQGLGRKYPFAVVGFAISTFSIAGLPFLASFVPRQLLLESLATSSLPVIPWLLAGSGGFLFSAIRAVAAMLYPTKEDENRPADWHINETALQVVLICTGILILIGIGVLPNIFLPPLKGLLNAFSRLRF